MKQSETHQQRIGQLREELARQQDLADKTRKKIRQTIIELGKEEISVLIPSEAAKEASRRMGPMDDIFFNKIGENKEAIGEVISTVLGIPVNVKDTVPQYTIAGIGNRGRL